MDSEEDLKEHIELQQQTIEEQRQALEKQQAEAAKLAEELQKIKDKQAEAKVATPVTSGAGTESEVQKWKAAAEEAAKLKETNAQLQARLDQETLTKEFPQIKDWSVVVGNNLEERRTHANKIVSMIGGKIVESNTGEADGVSKGDAFKGVPRAGGPSVDSLKQEEANKIRGEMNDAMKKGDVRTVLDKCFEMQPNATKALFQG